jgi:hypothetical protein
MASIGDDRAEQGMVLELGLTICVSRERRLAGSFAEFSEMQGKRGFEDEEIETGGVESVM